MERSDRIAGGSLTSACAISGYEGSRKLDGLDIGLGAKSQRPYERDMVAARCDVVVMHGKAHVVDAAFLDRLVVVVREAEWPNDDDAPLAILPVGDGIVVGR